MAGQKIGYVRVSTAEQNPDLQLKNIPLDVRFVEIASGKNPDRPKLEQLLLYARHGDCVYVESIDRMARNVIDLRNIVTSLSKKQVRIEFLRENLVFTGEDSPTSLFLLNIMGSLAEFERNLMRERQKEGIELAKKKGKYKGSKLKLTEAQVLEMKMSLNEGLPKTKIAKKLGVTRETLYRYIKKM